MYLSWNTICPANEIEHPIALQVGGNDPNVLSEAAHLAEIWGYDEINLNLGCPSTKVQSGHFGACLMAVPDEVAKCIEAMKKNTDLPITVKHRTGIDNFDSDKKLLYIKTGIKSAAVYFIEIENPINIARIYS